MFCATLVVLISSASVHSFFVGPRGGGRHHHAVVDVLGSTTTSSLFYRDSKSDDETIRRDVLSIPVLGPLPGHGPLVPGADLKLSPTPMQWQAIEEALSIQQKHLAKESSSGISAAPLVAIIDQNTAGDMEGRKGRYATIAAVVGVSADSKQIDMTDTSSFMESVTAIGRERLVGKVRLVGVGRAVLNDFFYQTPTHATLDKDGKVVLEEQTTVDEKTVQRIEEERIQQVNCEECRMEQCQFEEEDDDEEQPVQLKIIMAQFKLLMDGDHKSRDFLTDNDRSARSSPIHALNEMSLYANRIQFTHEDRRRYVEGLKAAKARLKSIREQEDDIQDHDGLGALFEQKTRERSQSAVSGFITEFGLSSLPLQKEETQSKSELEKKENYGMGFSAASVSTIHDLTSVRLEKLTPYYSPERCSSEEFHYETLSFVALWALEKYLEPTDLAWALRCTNTIERLHKAYDWMMDHVNVLRQEAQEVTQKLLDCGEECTDLF